MHELKMAEVDAVSGGLDADTGALAIIGLAVLAGPLVAAAGVTIGLGILLRDVF
jgi:hypothetical protein